MVDDHLYRFGQPEYNQFTRTELEEAYTEIQSVAATTIWDINTDSLAVNTFDTSWAFCPHAKCDQVMIEMVNNWVYAIEST